MQKKIMVCFNSDSATAHSSGPEKSPGKKLVKSNKSKKFFREIAFLAVLNFFPVQKLI